MSSTRSTRARGGDGAFGDFELYAVAPRGLDASARNADTRGGSTFYALVFLGNAPGDEDNCARGALLLHLRKESTRVLVLTPASVTVSREDTSSERSLEEHSMRLVSSLFPDFGLDDVRSMSGRGIMVVDPETWIILLGVEPWQFGVYAMRAKDINEAGRNVLDDGGNPCFSLRDTAPLFNFTEKRRVDELRRAMRRSCASLKVSAKGDSETLGVDEVMALVGLTENATEEEPSARLLKIRARRKERKQRKKAIRRERAAQETKRAADSSTPIAMTLTADDDDEEDSRDAHSTGSPASCVADIEDIDVKQVATTSDSKESACTLSCGECAYASTCDRKRKLDEVIKNTSPQEKSGCAFAFCSNITAGKEVELSQYVSNMPKRLRVETVADEAPRQDRQDWVVIGKKGRAIRDASGDDEALCSHSVIGESCVPKVHHAVEIGASADLRKDFNEVMTSLRILKDENQRLKAELHARKRKGDAGSISAEQIARGASILSVVHHWFSVGNLYRDEFLRSQMDVDGFVSLRILSTFPSLARLSVTPRELALLLTSSPVVELNATRDACRSTTASRPPYNCYQQPSA
jgi:hypothetical protein